MLRSFFVLLILIASTHATRAENDLGSLQVLKGRIIRALAVSADDPAYILVGQKSGKPGSAFVFRSVDGGRNWKFLNDNEPLSADATDVQAVVAVSKNVLLAGTWKHGLHISRDSGRNFSPVTDFPSLDVRDLQVADGVIYAATGRQGVFSSADEGKSWKALGPGKDFFWSLAVSKDGILASSPEQGVLEYRQQSWRKIFDRDIAYAAAASEESGLHAVAGETGLHVSSGDDWRKAIADEKFSDVLIIGGDLIVAGSWSNGVAIVSPEGKERKRLLEGLAVVHLQIVGDNLLVGTWGDGLHIIPLAQFLP